MTLNKQSQIVDEIDQAFGEIAEQQHLSPRGTTSSRGGPSSKGGKGGRTRKSVRLAQAQDSLSTSF